jgi:hypothetical protein
MKGNPTMKTDTFLSTIPFAGFYNSVHSDECDHTLEMMLSDRETGCDSAPAAICELANDAVDWSGVYRDYAADYAASFLDWLSLDGKFESVSSPKYYNFETDRIFVELTRSDLARIWRGVDKADLDKACRRRFTSRDGFISGYRNDWREWGCLSEWDHNQIGTLLQVYAEREQGSEWDQWAEFELMESARCNGGIDGWIWANADKRLARALNLWDYLQDRCKREVRTMAQWVARRRAENRPFAGTPLGEWSGA